MGANRDDIRVRIAGDLADIRRSIDDLKRQTASAGREAKRSGQAWRSLGRNFDSLRRQVAGVVGAYIGFRAVSGVVRGVTERTIEQERVTAQLEARLKSTGGAAGLTADQLLGMADRLQTLTTFGDEAVVGMQSLLLTFTQIRGPVFERATEAILDMSIALDEDLKAGATRLGKALNDPIRGISELREVGIGFTNAQIALVKQMVETGDIVGAQGVILDELEVQFGGAAEAARDTFGGAVASLSNAFGDLLEGGGGTVDDATEAVNELTSLLRDPATIEAFNNITAAVVTLTGALAKAAAGFARFGTGLGEQIARGFGAGTPIDQAQERIEFLQRSLDSLLQAGRRPDDFQIVSLREEIKLLEEQVALNKELTESRARIEARRTSGAGDDSPRDEIVLDGRPALRRLQAQLAGASVLLTDELKRLGEDLDREFEDNLVRFADYYRQRAELEIRAVDQQLESQRTALGLIDEEIRLTQRRGEATEETENKRAQLVAEITVLERQRAAAATTAAREQAAAERALAAELDQVRIRLLNIQGASVQARTAELETEFRELLQRLRVEGDSEGEALVRRLIDVELARTRLQEFESDYQRTLANLSREEQRLQALIDTGTISEREGRRRIIALHQETAAEVGQLIPLMRELAEATGDPAAIERLADLELELEKLRLVTDRRMIELRNSIQDAGENAFTSFITGAQKASSAWDSFVDNVKQRAAELLSEGIFDRLFELFRGTDGRGGVLAQAVGFLASVFHDGGIAGLGGRKRLASGIAFAGAPRLHSGGLLPNEIPAILERGEEVLTRRDPRHRDNFGGGNVTVNVQTRDAESFRRQSPGQIAAQVANELLRANNRNR